MILGRKSREEECTFLKKPNVMLHFSPKLGVFLGALLVVLIAVGC